MEAFQLDGVIGQGQYGTAYKARCKEDSQLYCLKRIPVGEETDVEAALREVELLASLDHPHIVGYKTSFLHEGALCIVTSLCGEGDLGAAIRRRAAAQPAPLHWSEDQVMDRFIQVAGALLYIHGRRILHRDLKTQNVFISRGGILKLGDFGISKALETTDGFACTVTGTPYYMAPEVCSSQPYTLKSDVWSLGCILYELCTLRHAFAADSLLALVYKVVGGAYEPLPPGQYSAEMGDLVAALLTVDPQQRPSLQQVLATPYVQAHVRRFNHRQRQLLQRSARLSFRSSSTSLGHSPSPMSAAPLTVLDGPGDDDDGDDDNARLTPKERVARRKEADARRRALELALASVDVGRGRQEALRRKAAHLNGTGVLSSAPQSVDDDARSSDADSGGTGMQAQADCASDLSYADSVTSYEPGPCTPERTHPISGPRPLRCASSVGEAAADGKPLVAGARGSSPLRQQSRLRQVGCPAAHAAPIATLDSGAGVGAGAGGGLCWTPPPLGQLVLPLSLLTMPPSLPEGSSGARGAAGTPTSGTSVDDCGGDRAAAAAPLAGGRGRSAAPGVRTPSVPSPATTSLASEGDVVPVWSGGSARRKATPSSAPLALATVPATPSSGDEAAPLAALACGGAAATPHTVVPTALTAATTPSAAGPASPAQGGPAAPATPGGFVFGLPPQPWGPAASPFMQQASLPGAAPSQPAATPAAAAAAQYMRSLHEGRVRFGVASDSRPAGAFEWTVQALRIVERGDSLGGPSPTCDPAISNPSWASGSSSGGGASAGSDAVVSSRGTRSGTAATTAAPCRQPLSRAGGRDAVGWPAGAREVGGVKALGAEGPAAYQRSGDGDTSCWDCGSVGEEEGWDEGGSSVFEAEEEEEALRDDLRQRMRIVSSMAELSRSLSSVSLASLGDADERELAAAIDRAMARGAGAEARLRELRERCRAELGPHYEGVMVLLRAARAGARARPDERALQAALRAAVGGDAALLPACFRAEALVHQEERFSSGLW